MAFIFNNDSSKITSRTIYKFLPFWEVRCGSSFILTSDFLTAFSTCFCVGIVSVMQMKAMASFRFLPSSASHNICLFVRYASRTRRFMRLRSTA